MTDPPIIAHPAYAAIELAATDDGRAICQATRRCVVQDCLANPWSYAELRLQRILRAAGIWGWRGDVTMTLDGQLLHPNILFRAARLVLELDGREVHDNRSQFLKDRERQTVFAAIGYVVLRFGWERLDDPEYVVRVVRRALAGAAR